MKAPRWIFTVCYWQDGALGQKRGTVVGLARPATAEVAFDLAEVPEEVRVKIRAEEKVRAFVDDRLDPASNGYYIHPVYVEHASMDWVVCIGSVHEVIA